MRRISGLGWSVSVAAYALLSACAGDVEVDGPPLSAFGEHAHAVLRDDVVVDSTARGEVVLRREGQSQTARDARPVETLIAGTDVKLQFRNGVALRVREVGLEGSPRAAQGAVSEAREGGTSYWTLADHQGFEEWLELAPGVAFAEHAVAQWEVDGALREVPETGGIHVLDASGTPRVYVSAPVAWLESGERAPATLRIEDGRIALYVDARGERVLVDPVWVPTSSMVRGVMLDEGSNTAIVLPDGDVLVPYNGRAERYNPTTAVWSDAGAVSAWGRGSTASRLADARVLLLAGRVGDIFDPLTSSWASTAPMSASRSFHSVTLLNDGRVLVVGGGSFPVLASAEIYDPVTNTWSAAAPISTERFWHSATRLNDGRVLVAGGSDNRSALNSAYVYNPLTNAWTTAGTMRSVRCRHTASLLPSGRVLITGGNVGMMGTSTAEIYDPVTNSFTFTGSMASPRDYHTATTMPDASILVVGGSFATSRRNTERYDEARATWVAGPVLIGERAQHVAALLDSGRVLVAGGRDPSTPFSSPLFSAEVLTEDSCGNGILDPGETCDDGNRLANDCCVTCALSPLGRVCRAEAGNCDVAERCDGVATTCPADVVLPASTVCRAAVRECDVVEVCSGLSGVCGPDAAEPIGSTCGAIPSGDCDLPDTCTGAVGAEAFCTPRVAARGTVCRAASSPCEIAATCRGTAICPPNGNAANGTSCSDGATCNGAESCLAGTCTSGTAPRCEDSDVCTTDMCAEPSGCTSVRIAGCCHFSSECPNLDGDPCTDPVCSSSNRCTEIARDCSDADTCTADSCIAGGGCAHTEIAGCRPQDAGFDAASVDASSRPLDVGVRDSGVGPSDAGGRDASIDAAAVRIDASMDSPPSASCGCRIPQPAPARSWLGLVTLGLLAVRTRRRSRPHPTAL